VPLPLPVSVPGLIVLGLFKNRARARSRARARIVFGVSRQFKDSQRRGKGRRVLPIILSSFINSQ